MGLVAQRHVGYSWTRDATCDPYTGRRILIHCSTREVLISFNSYNTLEKISILISILWQDNLEAKPLAQDPTVSKRWSCIMNLEL